MRQHTLARRTCAGDRVFRKPSLVLWMSWRSFSSSGPSVRAPVACAARSLSRISALALNLGGAAVAASFDGAELEAAAAVAAAGALRRDSANLEAPRWVATGKALEAGAAGLGWLGTVLRWRSLTSPMSDSSAGCGNGCCTGASAAVSATDAGCAASAVAAGTSAE